MTDETMLMRWQMMELKIAYYEPDILHESWLYLTKVTDSQYDRLENVLIRRGETIPVGSPEGGSGDLVRYCLNKPKARENKWISPWFAVQVMNDWIELF